MWGKPVDECLYFLAKGRNKQRHPPQVDKGVGVYLLMISLQKINGTPIAINAELIEIVESNPDTTILLTTGNRIVVKDPLDEVIRKVVEYRKAMANTNIKREKEQE